MSLSWATMSGPLKREGVLLHGGLFGLAVVAGLLATTGSPIAIGLFVGIGVGAFLLKRTDVSIWLVLIGTLVVNGLVGLAFPALGKLSWLYSMLGFFLLGAGLLAQLSARRTESRLPGFVVILLIMMAVSMATSLFGGGDMVEVFAGSKRAYQLWGVMLALAIMPADPTALRRVEGWLKLLLVIGLIQLPFALFERIVLVPKRVGMGNGVVPIDIVAGTFEASFEGGGLSSVMCMFLIVLLAYVFSAWRERIMSGRRTCLLALLLGVPLFIGETKLVLVVLPLMFVLVFAADIRRNPVVAGLAMVLGGGLTATLAWVYFSLFAVGTLTAAQQFQKAIDYNFGSVGYYDRYSLNRTTATTFWFGQHGLDEPVATIFGHGVGSSYAGTGSLAPGHLNRRYPFMAINLTGLSTLLWDTGLLGTTLFLGALGLAWRRAGQLLKAAREAALRCRLTALRVSLACIGFSLLYSNSIVSSMSHETIMAFTLGYLAWLQRAHLAGIRSAQRS